MRRWIKRIFLGLLTIVGLLVAFVGTMAWLGSRGYFQNWGLRNGQKQLAREMPEIVVPARAWSNSAAGDLPQTPAELFSLTNIWNVRLDFEPSDWKKIQPSPVPPVRNMMGADGKLVLRNPKASRNGLAGVVGIDFNWAPGQVDFNGRRFTNVAVRYRGNGTYINSLFGPKQSFKIDLNKYAKGQNLAGLDELNLLNSIADFSYVRDALAEQLFRDLRVPAPRTSYAYLTIDVAGTFTNQALGLYVLVENIDSDFAKDRFGSKKTPIFKPVTYELFKYLGEEWSAYQGIYDLKTEATPEQLQRVIEFARVVSDASDRDFETALPDYVDLDEFASFLAGHVLLSACDGFLANGQNFYLYLDPRSNRFGFISWDQDHSFGEFGYAATAEKRERMSIWEPSLYDFRFLQRVLAVPAFREIYRSRLEDAISRLFTRERLWNQVDQLASMIRPAVAAENDFRLRRFEQSVSEVWLPGPRDGAPEGPRSPVHQIKRFISNRVDSVQAQLAGTSEGEVLHRRRY